MWRTLNLVIALAAAPAGAAEIGRDTFLNAEESIPWRAVGRVNMTEPNRVRMCTGTLIRPDVVLTAAHCVVNLKTGALRPPGTVHFLAGWHKGKWTGHSKARRIIAYPEWKPGLKIGESGFFEDIALVQLETPIGPESATPFDISPLIPTDTYTMVGYRRDRPHALTFQDDCERLKQFPAQLMLICSAVGGASGSPIFVISPEGPRIVAVLFAGSPGKPRPMLFTAEAFFLVRQMLELLE